MPLSNTDISEIAEKLKSMLLPDLRASICSDLRSEIRSEIRSELREFIDCELKPLKNDVTTLLRDNSELQRKVADLEPLQNTISAINTENQSLKDTIHDLEVSIDRQEQYSRRDCLRINGILGDTGEFNENTDEKLLQMAEKANIPLLASDIDKSHRLGKPRPNASFNRTIIVKFSNSKARDRVIDARKSVGSVYINEDLSRYRQNLAFEGRKMVRERLLEQVVGGKRWCGLRQVSARREVFDNFKT